MESAAGVIAVLDLSTKVASLCFQYSKAVKNTKPDIKRLQDELSRLKTVIKGTLQLFETPSGTRLLTSQQLHNKLSGCSFQLTGLQTKLETTLQSGATRQAMSQFGIRALKWPFKSKGIDSIIATLERYQDSLSTAFTIDLTCVIVFFLRLFLG